MTEYYLCYEKHDDHEEYEELKQAISTLSPEAKEAIMDDGYVYWENLVFEMCNLSATMPGVEIHLISNDGGEYVKYVFLDGKYQALEEVTVFEELGEIWCDPNDWRGGK